jgi:hypothetical protein
MVKDPTAEPLARLLVAHANYELACQAKTATRSQLDGAIVKAAAAGLSHAEIGRAIGATGQRIGQIIADPA